MASLDGNPDGGYGTAGVGYGVAGVATVGACSRSTRGAPVDDDRAKPFRVDPVHGVDHVRELVDLKRLPRLAHQLTGSPDLLVRDGAH